MKIAKVAGMNELNATILGEAEHLAQLHDIIQFKSQAYDNQAIAQPLKECAGHLAHISEVLIRDVVHHLSVKNFPFTSREKGHVAPTEEPLAMLDRALNLFPARDALPQADITLLDMPKMLEDAKERIAAYADNKDAAIEELMKLQSQVISYLICIAWLDV